MSVVNLLRTLYYGTENDSFWKIIGQYFLNKARRQIIRQKYLPGVRWMIQGNLKDPKFMASINSDVRCVSILSLEDFYRQYTV